MRTGRSSYLHVMNQAGRPCSSGFIPSWKLLMMSKPDCGSGRKSAALLWKEQAEALPLRTIISVGRTTVSSLTIEAHGVRTYRGSSFLDAVAESAPGVRHTSTSISSTSSSAGARAGIISLSSPALAAMPQMSSGLPERSTRSEFAGQITRVKSLLKGTASTV